MRNPEYPDDSSHSQRREAQEASRAKPESQPPSSGPATPPKVLTHRITASRRRIADIFKSVKGNDGQSAA